MRFSTASRAVSSLVDDLLFPLALLAGRLLSFLLQSRSHIIAADVFHASPSNQSIAQQESLAKTGFLRMVNRLSSLLHRFRGFAATALHWLVQWATRPLFLGLFFFVRLSAADLHRPRPPRPPGSGRSFELRRASCPQQRVRRVGSTMGQ